MKTILFTYETPVGTFWIQPEPANRVRLGIGREKLKTYSSRGGGESGCGSYDGLGAMGHARSRPSPGPFDRVETADDGAQEAGWNAGRAIGRIAVHCAAEAS